MQEIIYRLEQGIFYIYWIIIKLFDEKAIPYVRFVISMFFTRYKKIVKINLEIAFGKEYSEQNWKFIFNSCIDNLLLNIATVIKNGYKNTTENDILQKVEFENKEIIDELLNKGESLIFTSGHFNNWELMATAISLFITPAYAVVEKLKNPFLDNLLDSNRKKMKVKTVPMKGAIKTLVSAIKRKESIMLLNDQSLNKGYGVEKKFFGKEAIHSETSSFLSKKYNSYIVPTYIFKIDNKYKIIFEKPFKAESINDPLDYELKILESKIKDKPDNWLWCHRRWKNNDGIYR